MVAGAFERLCHEITCRLEWCATFSGFSMWRRKMRFRKRPSRHRRAVLQCFLTSFWETIDRHPQHFLRTVAIWVKSRASCESRWPLAACALVAKLSSRSPMRSSPIMSFIHASNCRVSPSGTRVIVEVTPNPLPRRSHRVLSRTAGWRSGGTSIRGNALAAMAAASRASSQASTVRRTRNECEGSGGGVFTLAALINKAIYFFGCRNRSAVTSGITKGVAYTPSKA